MGSSRSFLKREKPHLPGEGDQEGLHGRGACAIVQEVRAPLSSREGRAAMLNGQQDKGSEHRWMKAVSWEGNRDRCARALNALRSCLLL